MSRFTFIVGLSALALAAGPAFAQTTAPGTVVPHHMTHPAPAHKMTHAMPTSPDMSADALNAKELASLQAQGVMTTTPPPPAAKKP